MPQIPQEEKTPHIGENLGGAEGAFSPAPHEAPRRAPKITIELHTMDLRVDAVINRIISMINELRNIARKIDELAHQEGNEEELDALMKKSEELESELVASLGAMFDELPIAIEGPIYVLYDSNDVNLYPAIVIPLDFDDYFCIDLTPEISLTIEYSRGG